MANKFLFSGVAVVGIAVAGASAWWLQSRPSSSQTVSAKAPGGKSANPSAPRVAGVEVARVALQPLRDDAQAVGTLRASQSVMLRPEGVGRITTLNFADGGRVRKGQVVVQFDDQLQRAELQQMQAQLGVAQASFKRTQELVAANFMAQQALDISAANVQVAQAQVALSQARLSRMAVRAPFDGVVGIRLVTVGDYVKDGVDLVSLEAPQRMLIDYRLPERYGAKVQRGQGVEVTLDAWPGRTFKAVVQAVDPLLDANGRSLAVRAALAGVGHMQASDTADQALRSGMFARVTTVFGVDPQALVVPEEAIVPQAGKQFVFKLVAAEPGAKLPPEVKFVSQRQEVQLGVRGAGKVQITTGVNVADTVVVAGQQRLQKDGTPVRVVELGRSAGKLDRAASAASGVAASADR